MQEESRRSFIKKTVAGLVTLGVVNPLELLAEQKSFNPKNFIGKVLIAKDAKIRDANGKINPSIADKLVNDGLKKLIGGKDKNENWSSIFNEKDVVGLKLNCLAGRGLSPNAEVVNAIIEGLKSAGVKEDNIIVWERFSRDLQRTGYPINIDKPGVKYYGTDAVGYDAEPSMSGSIGSCFSKIVSEKCTALINIGILKDHDLSGVSAGMKNFYGAIHNPNKYHDNNCDPYVADVNAHPFIKNKLRLIIIDAIKPQFKGGPGYKPQYTWDYNGIIMGFDPVAVDSVSYDILDKKRKEKGAPSLKEDGKEPKWIITAEKKGLGIADLKKIEIIEI